MTDWQIWMVLVVTWVVVWLTLITLSCVFSDMVGKEIKQRWGRRNYTMLTKNELLIVSIVLASVALGYSLKRCEPCALHESDIPQQCLGEDWALPVECGHE